MTPGRQLRPSFEQSLPLISQLVTILRDDWLKSAKLTITIAELAKLLERSVDETHWLVEDLLGCTPRNIGDANRFHIEDIYESATRDFVAQLNTRHPNLL